VRILDLFCGAGGAAAGLHRVFPKAEIIGVDNRPQPRYPFQFAQTDATKYPVKGFDFVWASPPCQKFTALKTMYNARKDHPDHVGSTRRRLITSSIPYVIENVPGAPLKDPFLLCGSMFPELRTKDGAYELRRHRLFEASFPIRLNTYCQHNGPVLGVYGAHSRDRRRTIRVLSHAGGEYRNEAGQRVSFPKRRREEVMGIDWMNGDELGNAVPPAYSEWIALQFKAWRKRAR
jgi:DNA (cytosine-5)-methyltransferase 1